MARTTNHGPGRRRRVADQKGFQTELLGKSYDNAAESESINKLKKRIRDAERLLQGRKDLPADIEVAKQRELQALNRDLELAERKKKRARLIKRYHQVRFFERQKADRRLKQCKRAVEDCKDPARVAPLQTRLHITQVDLNYTLFYPLFVPYTSLFHAGKVAEDTKEEGEDEALEARKKNEMWLRVERATAAGDSALRALRNEEPTSNQPELSHSPEPKQGNESKTQSKELVVSQSRKSKKSERAAKANNHAETKEESDNEFFE